MDPAADRLGHAPDSGPCVTAFRRWRAGKSISDEHRQHFASLTPNQRDQFETMAKTHDEDDRQMRRARRHGITVVDSGRVLPPLISTSARPLARRRGAGRPRAQTSRSRARAGPDSDEPEPALRLAPPPKTIYRFACLSPEQRGEA